MRVAQFGEHVPAPPGGVRLVERDVRQCSFELAGARKCRGGLVESEASMARIPHPGERLGLGGEQPLIQHRGTWPAAASRVVVKQLYGVVGLADIEQARTAAVPSRALTRERRRLRAPQPSRDLRPAGRHDPPPTGPRDGGTGCAVRAPRPVHSGSPGACTARTPTPPNEGTPVPSGTLAFKFCLRSFGSVPGRADVRVQRWLQPAGGCRTPPN